MEESQRTYIAIDFKSFFASVECVERGLKTGHVVHVDEIKKRPQITQLDLFTDYAAEEKRQKEQAEELKKERKLQETTLLIKKRFGKNAILKGLNFADGATARERNEQIGGHKA